MAMMKTHPGDNNNNNSNNGGSDEEDNNSSNNGSSNSSSKNNNNSGNAYKAKKRLEWILSRGVTARNGIVIENNNNNNRQLLSTSLSRAERDYDLRHLTAYAHAVDNYQQTLFIHANPQLLQDSSHHHHREIASNGHSNASTAAARQSTPAAGTPTASGAVSLPITIDPEEEKRRSVLAKTIARAEDSRAQLEQEYMALRAHYCAVSRDLQTATLEFQRSVGQVLPAHVEAASNQVAQLRAKLQIVKDVVQCLQYRSQLLLEATAADGGATADQPDVGKQEYPMSKEANELLALWNELMEQVQPPSSSSSSPSASTKGSKRSASASANNNSNAVVPWLASKQPATPYGVPLLLSTISRVPEKSLAFSLGTKNTISKDNSIIPEPGADDLCWLSSHVPSTVDTAHDVTEEEDNNNNSNTASDDDDDDDIAILRKRVAELEHDYAKELQWNGQILSKLSNMVDVQDNAVGMMGLLRHATEGVLARHNTIVTKAAESGIGNAAAGDSDGNEDADDVSSSNDKTSSSQGGVAVAEESNDESTAAAAETKKRESSSLSTQSAAAAATTTGNNTTTTSSPRKRRRL